MNKIKTITLAGNQQSFYSKAKSFIGGNLEGLCPNCHSITDTWRGRNKPSKNGVNIVTDEFLLQCLTETNNIRQGLLKAGLSAKGNNYARAKKLLGRSSCRLLKLLPPYSRVQF